ncbi:Outer membrane protein beta-barrel domain-containing protein [Mariniphaga anaerophila]|uniref:Outer membrane protein beta-barrel domain-containing protein n=1 Tax=Mariniphaga anaerophila TaxID=1484053 RepID=A0A1M5AKP3_9BACT|nr:porin family protein [Mariniphaga anaerophila]SHF30848.1 Outer membrane protein beta-barrel domain-containing protein [Mariniphaga anaerophila]
MKKFFSFIILTFIIHQCFSQSIKYGIGVGLNYTNLSSNRSIIDQFNYKPGFQINSIIEYGFSEKLGVRIEPGLADRGASESYNSTPDSKININYATVPILLNYSPFSKFSILIGPESSIRLTKKFIHDDNPESIRAVIDRKFDLGANLGLSYNLLNNLDISFRYNRGFISVLNNDLKFYNEYGMEIKNTKLHNQGFSIFLSYMIK